MSPRRLASRFSLALLVASPVFAGDILVDVRGANGKALTDAVVFAEPVDGAAPKPAGPLKATIDQVNKEFVPRVSVLRVGTTVSFPNSDNIRHSIYSFSPPKTFTTKLYSGKEAAPVVFDKPGLVTLGCNIHDLMVAWVVIVDTPWLGKSDKDGTGTLKGLPPGDYKVSTWYPSPTFEPVVQQVRVTNDAPAHLEVKLQVDATPRPEASRAGGG
ncbi:MAG: methylamine utilization protein [Gammaproteobacteria bacterium]